MVDFVLSPQQRIIFCALVYGHYLSMTAVLQIKINAVSFESGHPQGISQDQTESSQINLYINYCYIL